MAEKLTDNQVDDRLKAALEVIGETDGETTAGNAALKTARRTLSMLSLALIWRQVTQQREP